MLTIENLKLKLIAYRLTTIWKAYRFTIWKFKTYSKDIVNITWEGFVGTNLIWGNVEINFNYSFGLMYDSDFIKKVKNIVTLL